MGIGEHVLCRERHFRKGEDFFINRCTEKTEVHLHSHDCVEIAYVTSGKGIHTIGNEQYNVHKGDLFIVNCGVPHEFRQITENSDSPPLIVYNCIFTAKFLDCNLPDTGDFYMLANNFFLKNMFDSHANSEIIHVMNKDSSEIEEIYEKMLIEYTLQKKGYCELIRTYIIELIIKVLRILNEQKSLSIKSYQNHHKMFKDIMDYIKDNIGTSITITDLASEFNYSSHYLSKLFKSYTGMGLSDYIQKTRIEKACFLLGEYPNRNIALIANDVGYNDIKFFNKIFRRIAGKTPSQFRCERTKNSL